MNPNIHWSSMNLEYRTILFKRKEKNKVILVYWKYNDGFFCILFMIYVYDILSIKTSKIYM